MKIFSAIAVASVAVSLAGSAGALTLTNNDDAPHALLVIDDANMSSIVIYSGQTLRDFCPFGCRISLGDSGEQAFKGDEVASIKNGEFVFGD